MLQNIRALLAPDSLTEMVDTATAMDQPGNLKVSIWLWITSQHDSDISKNFYLIYIATDNCTSKQQYWTRASCINSSPSQPNRAKSKA